MRKIFLLATALMLMCSTALAAVGIKEHPTIAVMQFADKAIKSEVDGIRGQDFSSASEYANYQLNASNWFDLVDYEQMIAIARMHSMYQSGMFDQSAAPMLGKFATAQYILAGSLTGMTVKESGAKISAGAAGAGMSKHTVTANVVVRFVDVETLKIVGMGMGTGKSSSTSSEISFKPFRNPLGYIGGRQTTINVNIGDGNTNVNSNGFITMDDPSFGEYSIRIGSTEVSAVQVRNALGKAVRDAIYGKSGILTSLNDGKPLKIKTDF